MINYARQHPHLALAAALIVLAGCSWLTVMLVRWWWHRPAAYPVQQYTEDGEQCINCLRFTYYPGWGCTACGKDLGGDWDEDRPDEWEDLEPDEQADQLIAEWHDEPAERLHDPSAWHWQDDPDLIVWDAKQQADRCWQILYVEFPALRRELGIAA